MSLEDEIDGPTALMKPASKPWQALRVRHLVYLQLFTLMLCVVFGQCEVWGYSDVLERGMLGTIFSPIVMALFSTAVCFPVAKIVVMRGEESRRTATWMAALLSIAMSLTQILALLPLFQ
jgi:hypothetical protein